VCRDTPSKKLLCISLILLSCVFPSQCIESQTLPSDRKAGPGWVSILDTDRVTRAGAWEEHSFRYAKTTCLRTDEDGVALTVRFIGTGVALGLGQHAVAAYGQPTLGKLLVSVDGGDPVVVYPRDEAREVTVARGLEPGPHTLRVEHRIDAGTAGCRLSGIRE